MHKKGAFQTARVWASSTPWGQVAVIFVSKMDVEGYSLLDDAQRQDLLARGSLDTRYKTKLSSPYGNRHIKPCREGLVDSVKLVTF